jgi:cobaltochelatase CobT
MALSSAQNKANHGNYRVFTTKFDREVDANELKSVLGPLSTDDEAALNLAWHELQTGLLPWTTRLHVAAASAAARIRGLLSDDERANTAVSILLDQSGSMRGQKMLFTAAAVDVAQEFLVTLGITCEILGFTTSQWRGGRSRKRWKWRFKPRFPGRLNDILHIVYRQAADRRSSSGGWSFRQMLRPDLPKENIDGEAILWAVRRLRALPQSRQHLVIVSDGAPVDDSTLLENGPTYLSDHLRAVVSSLVEAGDIRIAAIGIGYYGNDFYPIRSHIDTPDDLGTTLISLLEQSLTSAQQSAPSTPGP